MGGKTSRSRVSKYPSCGELACSPECCGSSVAITASPTLPWRHLFESMGVTVAETAGVDKSSLLNQLRIDRSEPPSSAGGHAKWWGAGVVVAVIAGTGIWYLLRPTGLLVSTAVAQPASS